MCFLFARLACSTDSVCVIFFGFTRPAGPVLTGAVGIVLMTVPKLSKNVLKNVPITLSRERYTSRKKYLANVPELYQKNVPITLSRERYTTLKKAPTKCPKIIPKMSQSPNVGSIAKLKWKQAFVNRPDQISHVLFICFQNNPQGGASLTDGV